MRGLWSPALVAATLGLAACATSSPAPGPAAAPPDVLVAQRERVAADEAQAARRAAAAGRLREALWRWRAVEAVARDPGPARTEAASLQARIQSEVQAEVARGEAARRARDPATASSAFQAALALDPRAPAPLASLREMETATVLGQVAQEQSAAARRVRRKAAPKKGATSAP